MPQAKTKKSTAKPKKTAAKPKKVAAKPRPRATKPTSMKAGFKKKMALILNKAKSKMLAGVSMKIHNESGESKSKMGDIYDLASDERERELTLTLGDRDRGKLADIEDALERIGDGTYGECEECGEPIADNRLQILPFTKVCVECQSKKERDLRIRGGGHEEHPTGMIDRSAPDEEEL